MTLVFFFFWGGGGGGGREEGGDGNLNFAVQEKKFEKNEKTSKHRILQQEEGLYIQNLVIGVGQGHHLCTHSINKRCLSILDDKKCNKCLLYE